MNEGVAQLRRAFDDAFALPPAVRIEETDDLLAISVAGDAYAVRLRDIDAVVTGRRIVPVPGKSADCIGVAGIRGTPVPVFDLAALLGYPPGDDAPKWMILCGREEGLALAFSVFEGYLRLPRAAVQGQGTREVVETAHGVRTIVGVAGLVSNIRSRTGRKQPGKEQR